LVAAGGRDDSIHAFASAALEFAVNGVALTALLAITKDSFSSTPHGVAD
jgi:hypothetical protein